MTEHLPIERHPENDWEYGVNYGARRVRVFMDKVDWDFEVGQAAGGNRVYASLEDIKEACATHIAGCGIVEVEMTLVRIIDYGKYDATPEGGCATGEPR